MQEADRPPELWLAVAHEGMDVGWVRVVAQEASEGVEVGRVVA